MAPNITKEHNKLHKKYLVYLLIQALLYSSALNIIDFSVTVYKPVTAQ